VTKKEAIKCIEQYLHTSKSNRDLELKDAVTIAVEALKRERKRDKAIKKLKNASWQKGEFSMTELKKALPTKQQEDEMYVKGYKQGRAFRETASWEYDEDAIDWGIGAWVCSRCKNSNGLIPTIIHQPEGEPQILHDQIDPYAFSGSQYCPHCGAKMQRKENLS